MYGYCYSLYNRLAFVVQDQANPAQAFLDATGITDETIVSAITTLVADLQTYNLWGKMKAVYPFVGGTQETNKFNLINPQDTDEAFRLTFSGNWDYNNSGSGAKPDGFTGYANTYLNPSQILNQDSTHLSIFGQNVDVKGVDMGCIQFNDTSTELSYRQSFITAFAISGINSSESISLRNGLEQDDYLIGSRIDNTTESYYTINDGNFQNITKVSASLPYLPILIGARQTDLEGLEGFVIDQFASKVYGFASIGDGLDLTDATNLLTSVSTFLTTLNRL
jgi:hypothetical protein